MLCYNLPPEIQDEIFEWAACMHPNDRLALSLISKRVQTRVEKVIYESLYLFPGFELPYPRPKTNNLAHLSRFLRTLHNRPLHFFATHVRNIYFQPDVSHEDAKFVLEKCPGIQHLGLLVDWPSYPEPNFPPCVYPHANTLRSLMTTRDVLIGMTKSGIVFPGITYLVISMWPYFTSVPALECLPALNIMEMILEDEPWDGDVNVVLSSTSNLQFMSLHVHRSCADAVKRWRETVVSLVRIKMRVNGHRDPFPGNWQRLTTGTFDPESR
ncbi:hypothetical protein C0995_007301 [Termitomyces sp. Mi166|nr:hypothetical protein C0995_007301 [Termitomyces sp. Mi166\